MSKRGSDFIKMSRGFHPYIKNLHLYGVDHPINGIPDTDITSNDVLFGRGGRTNRHEGNIRFRQIVDSLKQEYSSLTNKVDKTRMAEGVVDAVRDWTPHGRFLKRDKATMLWRDVGDAIARKKMSQTLREPKRDSAHSWVVSQVQYGDDTYNAFEVQQEDDDNGNNSGSLEGDDAEILFGDDHREGTGNDAAELIQRDDTGNDAAELIQRDDTGHDSGILQQVDSTGEALQHLNTVEYFDVLQQEGYFSFEFVGNDTIINPDKVAQPGESVFEESYPKDSESRKEVLSNPNPNPKSTCKSYVYIRGRNSFKLTSISEHPENKSTKYTFERNENSLILHTVDAEHECPICASSNFRIYSEEFDALWDPFRQTNSSFEIANQEDFSTDDCQKLRRVVTENVEDLGESFSEKKRSVLPFSKCACLDKIERYANGSRMNSLLDEQNPLSHASTSGAGHDYFESLTSDNW